MNEIPEDESRRVTVPMIFAFVNVPGKIQHKRGLSNGAYGAV